MTLAARLPYSHPFAGGYPRLGGQPLPTDPDAIDYLQRQAAVDGPVEVGVAMAVDAFVKGCKADGIWSAIKASCIMCGARTISGALVPLRTPYGDELVDIDNLPTPTIQDFGGSTGVWDAETKTVSSSTTGTDNTFPRFKFSVGMTAGKRYRVTGRLTLNTPSCLTYVRVGYTTAIPLAGASVNSFEFDSVFTCGSPADFEIDLKGTVPGASVTIESLSIREDSFTPTPYNFTGSDYSRTTGLVGDGSTTYLDTNRANDADGQDDNHNAVYVTDAQVGSLFVSGVGVTGINYIDTNTSSSARVINRDGSITVSGTIGSGTYASSRSDSAEYDYFTPQGSGTQAGVSVAPNALNVLAFVRSDGSSLSAYSTARLAFYSIGSAISDLAALDNRVTNLVKGIQFWHYTGLSPHAYDPDTIAYVVAGYAAGGTL